MTQNKSRKNIYAEIDANLRKAYQETLKEELPDRFKDLIAQLRDGEIADDQTTGPDESAE